MEFTNETVEIDEIPLEENKFLKLKEYLKKLILILYKSKKHNINIDELKEINTTFMEALLVEFNMDTEEIKDPSLKSFDILLRFLLGESYKSNKIWINFGELENNINNIMDKLLQLFYTKND